MATKLRELQIERIDLVDNPANPDARIVLFKRDGTEARSAWEQIQADAASLITKSATPLTKAQAITQVVERNPALYARYQDERPNRANPGTLGPSPTWQMIERQAIERVAKSGYRLTKAMAIDAVVKEHPELYTAYRREVYGR
jgi:hypothetical protein